MNEILHNIEMRRRSEAMMILKLLALVFSKQLLSLNHIPDWHDCVHVDMETSTDWPDAERQLMPILNNLAGSLNHKSKEPTDICIVRVDGLFCIYVRT